MLLFFHGDQCPAPSWPRFVRYPTGQSRIHIWKSISKWKRGHISCRTYCILSHQGFSGIQQLQGNDDVSLRCVAASPGSEHDLVYSVHLRLIDPQKAEFVWQLDWHRGTGDAKVHIAKIPSQKIHKSGKQGILERTLAAILAINEFLYWSKK